MKKVLLIIVIFFLGLYFCLNYSSEDVKEGFKKKDSPRCANVLYQDGEKINLLNTGLARIPGVNPLVFNNLDEYVEFTKWQRSQGILCPALYLQKSYDTQGEPVYQTQGDPMNPGMGAPPYLNPGKLDDREDQKLLDAGHDDKEYNINSYPGFDAHDQYVGVYTPLDKMYSSGTKGFPHSANAMDTNWGGPNFSQDVVESGYFADNEVSIRIS